MTQQYESKQLTPEQIKIILSTVPILEQAGETLTQKFYQRMIGNYDEVKPFFNETDQKLLRQPKILAFALLNYAKNIEDLAPLTAFVKQIVAKHVGLQVKAEHYPIVGTCLIETMIELLPAEVANDQFIEAWSTAYGNLAKLLIDLEADEYNKQPWNEFKEFSVTKIEDECEEVKSIYFKPIDGKIGIPKRGQYVCIRWKLPNAEFEKSREYSISQYPQENEYRISVRKLPDGQISGYIHETLKTGDIIKVAPPAGNFVYEEGDNDVVLVAGGIGITPLVSILEQALADGRNVNLLYANRTVNSRAFGEFLKERKQQYGDKLNVIEYFSDEKVEEKDAVDQVENRMITTKDLEFINGDKHDVYLLGPRPFMRFVRDNLEKKNIAVKLEYFGSYDP
ncbi:Flavohemoprotein [Spathaspora sp. JA1]|nr:Flavohemoprotein [Spathaspora sp. JA1]